VASYLHFRVGTTQEWASEWLIRRPHANARQSTCLRLVNHYLDTHNRPSDSKGTAFHTDPYHFIESWSAQCVWNVWIIHVDIERPGCGCFGVTLTVIWCKLPRLRCDGQRERNCCKHFFEQILYGIIEMDEERNECCFNIWLLFLPAPYLDSGS